MNNQADDKIKARPVSNEKDLAAERLQDAQSFTNCFGGSLVLSIAIFFGALFYSVKVHGYIDRNQNDYWWIAPLIIVGGLIPPVVSGLLRGSWRKGFRAPILIVSLMPPFGFAFLLGFIYALTISNAYTEAPVLANFAQLDFAKYDSAGTGQVRSDVLQKVVDEQIRLRDNKANLGYMKRNLDDLSAIGPAAKHQLQADIEAAQKSLVEQMINDDELSRVVAVRWACVRAGTAVQPSPVSPATPTTTTSPPQASSSVKSESQPVYSVTRSQLTGYQQMLDSKYPLWLKVLRKLKFI
jgi:hypothetical protein